jgi:hypothetical protein
VRVFTAGTLRGGEKSKSKPECAEAAEGIRTLAPRAIGRIAAVIIAILRELADETPYRRYLAAHGSAPSREMWRRFSEERMRDRYARAKCC